MNQGADISQGQKQVRLPSNSRQFNELAYALGFFSCDMGLVTSIARKNEQRCAMFPR